MTREPMIATWDQLWKRFDHALAALPDDVRDAAVDALRPELPEAEAPPTRERAVHDSYGSDAGLVYYAVHDSELLALEKTSGALAGIAAILLASSMPIAAVGGLLGSLAAWWWKYRRRRIELTLEQALVLRRLKGAGSRGVTLDDLWASFGAGEQLIVDRDEVERVLTSLSDVIRADGARTKLVDRDGERWWRVDV